MTNNNLSDERIDELTDHVGVFTLERGDDLRDIRTALLELQEYRKATGEPVADVVAWSSPHEERKCDIRWRRLDVAPGPLFTSPQSMLVAPEIVPDALRDEIIDLCAGYEIGDQGAQEIWEACRAAMFASSSQEVTP